MITDKTARDVVDAASKKGRQVTVTLRPGLAHAEEQLTRAKANLAAEQAAYDVVAKAPAVVWTGTATFDPTRGGHVTLTRAVCTGGEPSPPWIDEDTVTDKEPATVILGLDQIAAIAQGAGDADPDGASRIHGDSGGPVVDPRWPGSRGAQ